MAISTCPCVSLRCSAGGRASASKGIQTVEDAGGKDGERKTQPRTSRKSLNDRHCIPTGSARRCLGGLPPLRQPGRGPQAGHRAVPEWPCSGRSGNVEGEHRAASEFNHDFESKTPSSGSWASSECKRIDCFKIPSPHHPMTQLLRRFVFASVRCSAHSWSA